MDNITQITQDQSNKDLMTSWIIYLKGNKHNKDEVSSIYTNLYNILSELAEGSLFTSEDYQNEGERFFLTSFSPDLIKIILQDNRFDNKGVQSQILTMFLEGISSNLKNPKLQNLIESCVNIFSEENNFFKNYEKDATEVF